jgi:23S rRNA (guanosine2251-2'-O)-methyltransferase
MARGRTTGAAGARDDGLVVYGANAVLELLASGAPVHRVHLGRGPREAEVSVAARRRGVPVAGAERGALDRLAGSPHHQGAVAETPPYRYASLEQLLASQGGSALVLDGIQDPRNLGAILRTARAAGVGGVILPRDRSVGVTPVVVAASAGVLFGLQVAQVTNVARAMDALKGAGFWLVGLVPRDGTALDRFERPERPALVLGGEGEGLRPLVRRGCDFAVSIPMAPGVESLNASVAAAIVLWELVLRRRS